VFSPAFWEWVEYISVFVVILGVVGEYIADFKVPEKTEKDRLRQKRISKVSTLILIAGLAVELLAIWRINDSTGTQIASIEHESESAKAEAKRFERDIATSRRAAAEAGHRAANARLDAAKANERAAVANAKAESLKAEIATSKREQARLALTTEGLRKENIEAAERLETEKRERLKAEKYLAPRDIGEQYSFGQALSKFKGLQVMLDSVTDAESRRLAETLEFSLVGSAQWKFLAHPPMDESRIPGGVVIEYRPNFFEQEGDASEAAARALADTLNARNISAQALPVSPIAQPNTLHVTIGLKPSPQEEEVLKKFREVFEKQYRSWVHLPK